MSCISKLKLFFIFIFLFGAESDAQSINLFTFNTGGGYNNTIDSCADGSGIFAGKYNSICGQDQYYSAIIAGSSNTLSCGNQNSTIIGGCSNQICGYSGESAIIGGCNNNICDFSCQSVIVGGCCNYIINGSEGSVIIGKILKELYLDSAIRRGENLDKENPIVLGENLDP
jgi:hypothetical protein